MKIKIDKKIIFIAVGVVLILVVLLATYLLIAGISEFSNIETKLVDLALTHDKFFKNDPFPNEKNLEIQKQNNATIEGWMRSLLESLKLKQVETDLKKSPSGFMTLLGDKKKSLLKAADDAGALHPREFGFGFEKYSESGTLPVADDVPRLTQQLGMIENISSNLFRERIRELLSVDREEFEGRSVGREEPVRARRPAGARRPTASTDGINRISSLAMKWNNDRAGEFLTDDALQRKFRFSFEFTAKQNVLLNVLNALVTNEIFTVVTSVDIEGEQGPAGLESDEGLAPKSGKSAFEQKRRGGLSSGPSAMSENLTNMTRHARMVLGPELEKPARIKMHVEVYRFK